MNKRLLVGGVAIGLAVVIAAGGLYASNMGFKLNYPLNGAGVGGSKSGQNTLSLPFNPQVGIGKASDLFFDIGTTAQLASVARLVESSDLLQIYKGTAIGGGPNFALNKGEGVFVNLKAGIGPLNYIVVGSHDPNGAHHLGGPGQAANPDPGTSKSGQNVLGLPYHFTGTKASDLFFDIGTTTNIASVARLVLSTDLLQIYKGTAIGGGPNFALTPGEAYVVSVKSGFFVNYQPSHY